MVMVLEGLIPFVSPRGYKNMVQQMAAMPEQMLRNVGLVLMISGLLFLYLFNPHIDLIDVRIKKVELPENVSLNVYRRMATERQTVAKEFRSRGEEQAKQIRANADRQREEILAEAYRKSEQIRGEGDATSTKTYADSYNQDREFYSFYRSMKAYENSFGNNQDIILLSPDSDFFKYFKKSK